jgi:hypothetical protein
VLNSYRTAVLVPLALLTFTMFARADRSDVLGIDVTPRNGGGVTITQVDQGSLGDDLDLQVGQIIFVINDPDAGIEFGVVNSGADLDDALASFPLMDDGNRHAQWIFFDPQRGWRQKNITYTLLGDPQGVSLREQDETATTFRVALTKDRGKGPLKQVHKVKPRSIKHVLAKNGLKVSKKGRKGKMRLVRGSVKTRPTHALRWHPLAKKAGNKHGRKHGRKHDTRRRVSLDALDDRVA